MSCRGFSIVNVRQDDTLNVFLACASWKSRSTVDQKKIIILYHTTIRDVIGFGTVQHSILNNKVQDKATHMQDNCHELEADGCNHELNSY